MYPHMYHPVAMQKARDGTGLAKFHTRTMKPVKYFLVNLSMSRMFDLKDPAPREYPIHSGPDSVPEAQFGGRCDPFPGDVYCLGNMLRAKFLQASSS